MDTRQTKRRCMYQSHRLASLGSASRSTAQPKDDNVDTTIMNRPINIRLTYTPPPAVCMDSETSIRSATENEINERGDVKQCPVCFEDFGRTTQLVATQCGHFFHRSCLLESLKHSTKCPVCRKSVAAPRGKCPPATMSVSLINNFHSCPGLTPQLIQIGYALPSGVQSCHHEAPGRSFSGTSRNAYLLNDVESRQLLKRLCFAFMHGLTFTVGTSLTSGASNTVTWASIHHKTNIGHTSFALPDESYVHNCNEELDNLNVPPAQECDTYF
jgi:deltex